MSTDMTQLEIDFYLSASSNVTELETLEISHPSFSRVFRLTHSDALGFNATLETDEEVFFEYLPMSIRGSSLTTDLDYGVSVSIGDLGTMIQQELDRVDAAETWDIYPKVVYRMYRSDHLEEPMHGPIELQIMNYTYNNDGFAFDAQAPDVKSPGTGELYTLERFPTMLAYFYA